MGLEDRAERMAGRARLSWWMSGAWFAVAMGAIALTWSSGARAAPVHMIEMAVGLGLSVVSVISAVVFICVRDSLRKRASRAVKGAPAERLAVDVPPVLGEWFKPFRVVESSEHGLHLALGTPTRLWIFRRLCYAILIVAGVTLGLGAAILGSRGRGGSVHGWQFFLHIGAIAGGLSKLVGPQVVQWMVEQTGRGPRLSIEIVRWIVIRRVVDLEARDIARFHAEVAGEVTSVMVELERGGAGAARPVTLKLLSLPGGPLGVWRSRRIAGQMEQLMGIGFPAPVSEADEGDEEAEEE